MEPLNYTRKKPEKTTINNLQDSKKYKGEITLTGQKLIYKRLTSWFNAIKIYNIENPLPLKYTTHIPVFITLTMSGENSYDHREIKRKLLQQFLKQLYYQERVKHYFWKAELQKNGRIHFHLVIDGYIDKKEIQYRWNALQKKHNLLIEFEKKYKRDNPPSTHVKMIYDYDLAVNYVMKYVSKKETGKIIDGGTFRFSKQLLELKPFQFENLTGNQNGFIDFLRTNTKMTWQNDFASLHKFKTNNIIELLPENVKRNYTDYYVDLYSQLYLN